MFPIGKAAEGEIGVTFWWRTEDPWVWILTAPEVVQLNPVTVCVVVVALITGVAQVRDEGLSLRVQDGVKTFPTIVIVVLNDFRLLLDNMLNASFLFALALSLLSGFRISGKRGDDKWVGRRAFPLASSLGMKRTVNRVWQFLRLTLYVSSVAACPNFAFTGRIGREASPTSKASHIWVTRFDIRMPLQYV
jgi:hypothetical protein